MKDYSKNIEDFYLLDYESIMNSGLVGCLWRHIHNSLDKPFVGLELNSIIEVGSGNGQHFRFSKVSTKEYIEVDIRNHYESKIRKEIDNRQSRKFVLDDAVHLRKFENETFDGLIATCLLAHLAEIELTLSNWRRVVKPGGILSIYIPNEPGLLLRMVRSLTTKRRIKKKGYNHEFIHWKEHRNHFLGMRSMIKHVFVNDSIKFKNFPLSFLTWNLGLYTLIEIKKNSVSE